MLKFGIPSLKKEKMKSEVGFPTFDTLFQGL